MLSLAENLLGALFIEVSLAFVLYGVTTTQSYFYWWNFRDDDKLIRWTVLIIWIVETAHTAFCMHMIYHYMITDYGNLEAAARIVWSAGATVITEVSIAAIVQSFFIRRIWILSQKSVLITCIPVVLLVVRIAFGYAAAGMTWAIHDWVSFRHQTGPFFTVAMALSLAAASDLVIATILLYYLQSSRTGFRGTDRLIRSLQAYIINSGALTMMVSLAIVLTYVFVKNNLLYAGLVQMQGKLYANSFLATLNTRASRNVSTKASSMEDGAGGVELASRHQHLQIASGQRHIEIFQHVSRDVERPPQSEIDEPVKSIGDMDSATDEYPASKQQTLV